MLPDPERVSHFRILSPLGKGGMGVVYRARDENLERDVALKLVRSEHTTDSAYRSRFLREARAAAAVAHPCFVTIYEAGEAGDTLFIAMELLTGKTLRDALPELTVARALEIGAAIADALARAHAAGIVHRDIKPENVFLTDDGTVKVLDFGIARLEGRDTVAPDGATEVPLTQAGAVLGTAGYMSPEQALGNDVGAASDIFSLGVVLYEALARAPPFVGSSMLARAIAVTRDDPDPLADRAAVPAEVAALVHRCLARDPGERPPSAADLADRLRRLAGDLATSPGESTSLSMRPETQQLPPSIAPTPPTPTPFTNPARLARWRISSPVGAFVAVLAFALYVVTGANQAAIEPEAAPPAASTIEVATADPNAPMPITSLPITGTDSPEAKQAYAAALADFRRADWSRAAEHLREALRHDPAFVLAALRLAYCDGVNGKIQEARARLKWVSEREAALDERHKAWLRAVEAIQVSEPADNVLAAARFEEAAARWPGDAEMHYMAASMRQRSLALDAAALHASIAISLDPDYADALQLLARSALLRGDATEAARLFDRCIGARGTDCIHDRLRLHARDGKCADAIADAKFYDANGGGGTRHWVYAASAVLSQGDSLTEAETFLQRAETGAETDVSRAYVRLSRVRLQILRGRFDTASKALDLAAEGADNLANLAEYSTLRAAIALETGDAVGFKKAAERYLAQRNSAPAVPFQRPTRDPAPWLWSELERAGHLDRAELEGKLGRWRSDQRRVGFGDGPIWFQSHALLARTSGEAKSALASRPADFLVEQVQSTDLGWDVAGRLDALAGDPRGAIAALERATGACTRLVFPVEHVRAWASLGEAYEAVRDEARACESFAKVIATWGDAKPTSSTATRARARTKALRCAAR